MITYNVSQLLQFEVLIEIHCIYIYFADCMCTSRGILLSVIIVGIDTIAMAIDHSERRAIIVEFS